MASPLRLLRALSLGTILAVATSASMLADDPAKPPSGSSDDDVERQHLKELLSLVEDGTVTMKAREMPAYFHLVRKAMRESPEELEKQAHDLRFHDFRRSADKHRGELVRLKLNVRRINRHAVEGENVAGAKEVYELWGWTEEDKKWLYVGIAAELPSGLKPGEVEEKVTLVGYFLKMQGYHAAGATPKDPPSVAPAIIGRVIWDPPPAKKPGGKSAPAPAVEKSKETSNAKVLTIRGRVVDAQGHGIAKAQVWLPLREEPRSQVEAVADKQGSFQLTVPDDWLQQPFWRSRSEIWAYAKGHAIARASIEAAFFDGSKDPVEIRLGPLTKTSFVVVDPEGKPVVGASVTPQGFYVPKLNRHYQPPAPLAALLSAVADDKGRAALPAVSTRRLTMLRVVSKQYGTQDQMFPDVPEDAPERTIRLRAVGRIEGQVIAAKPQWTRGIKLSFKDVAGYPPAGGSASVETDTDGKFVVPQIAVGRFSVADALDPRLPVRAVPQSDHVRVTAGETTMVTVFLVPAVRVRGRVWIVESDKPLPGAMVRVFGNLREGVETRVDDAGRYEVLLAPGKVFLNIHLPREYHQKLVPRFIDAVSVPEGVETFDLPTIELVKLIRYEGRLIDSDGKPVAGAVVSGNDGRRNIGRGDTDRDGKFNLIAPVDIESYRVWVKDIPYDALLEKSDPLLLKLPVAVK